MTDSSAPADPRPRSALPLLVAILALIVAGGALWVSYGNATKLAASKEHAAVAPPSDPAIEQIKETLSSLQQAVRGIQADQQRQAERVGDVQQGISIGCDPTEGLSTTGRAKVALGSTERAQHAG
ncbi:hypothetical protein [Bradyrhizobium brasilense]|uniref:hypothetical protein n=1 Tax=Bradyrhizobium brasilense TaxID=1419277 RepID=UPI001E5EC14B|nr:hypothetical protein [Bradyrhizobium brasilense]MCC8975354.1 hypothetical protein [Bradyrhizobium brasilense]